jgi:hypothetical protein
VKTYVEIEKSKLLHCMFPRMRFMLDMFSNILA